MIRCGAALGFAAVALQASPAAAYPRYRQEGAAYHRCAISQQVPIFTIAGRTPEYAHRENGRLITAPWPESGTEGFSASVEVNADGALSNLDLSWSQAGIFGWPHSWRTDIHPIAIRAEYKSIQQPRSDDGRFDPAAVKIELRVASEQRLRGAWRLELRKESTATSLMALGGDAELPSWGRSADATILWGDLDRYADGAPYLFFELLRADRAPRRYGDTGSLKGTLYLDPVRRAIAQLQVADRQLREMAATNLAACERRIEPVPNENALIAVTGEN